MTSKTQTRVVALMAGPTASGKSAFALKWARDNDAVIINTDSMQVYGDLEVITARPSCEERAVVTHYLDGHVPAEQAYSVAQWYHDVKALLDTELAEQSCIFVGGTGLYFKALTEGLSAIPDIDGQIREYWRGEAQSLDAQALHAILQERDPEMAVKLSPQDTQRVTRALEVFDSTGVSLAEWQKREGLPPLIDVRQCPTHVLNPDRAVLRSRIEARAAQMLDEGALEEVQALLARDLDPALPVMKAIGVPEIAQFLEGSLDRTAVQDAITQQSSRYAKRQMTWFRKSMADWHWIDPTDQ